jgi:hypothetical protein
LKRKVSISAKIQPLRIFLDYGRKKYPELNDDDLIPERGYVLDTFDESQLMEGINGLLVGVKYSTVKSFKTVRKVFSAIPTGAKYDQH